MTQEEAEERFRQLLKGLESTHAGKYVMFNLQDGSYAVGTDNQDTPKVYHAQHGEPPQEGRPFVAALVPLTRNALRPGVYKHFKGNTYHVLGVSENTETSELSVVYIPQYGKYAGKLADRPLKMFLEEVDRPELNYKGPRFQLIEEKNFLVP